MPRNTADFNEGSDNDFWSSAANYKKTPKKDKFNKLMDKEHERGDENWPPTSKFGE